MPAGERPGTPDCSDRRRLVQQFLPELATWVDPATGIVRDPHETEYAEGFGPALASVLFAKGYEWSSDPQWRALALATLERSLNAAESCIPHNSAFTNVFLAYYALHAVHLIKNALTESVAENLLTRLAAQQPLYEHNLNGWLMGWMHRVNLDTLGRRRCDWHALGQVLERVREQQSPRGFFNDDLKGNGSPIAYHLLCYLLISQTLALRSHFSEKWEEPAFEPVRETLLEALRNEQGWVLRFTAADGSFSMTERGHSHFWSAGAYVAYLRQRGASEQHPLAASHLRYWSRFAKSDGTFSITPNWFSNLCRVGFEPGAKESLYVTLGLALLALSEGDFLPAEPFHPLNDREDAAQPLFVVDEQSGYAHWRRAGTSLGVSLAQRSTSRSGGYTLAGGLFNVCVGGSPQRVVAAPAAFPVGYQLRPKRATICHEGLLVLGPGNELIWPCPTAVGKAREREDALTVDWEQAEFHATRSLRIDATGVVSRWDLIPKRPLKAIEVTVPIVIDDGRGVRDLSIDANEALVSLPDGSTYVLRTNGAWKLDVGLSADSTSGLVRSLRIECAPLSFSKTQPASIGWSLRVAGGDGQEHAHRFPQVGAPNPIDLRHWGWKYGDVRWLSCAEDWLTYDIPDGERIYLVSGGPLQSWEDAPQSPFDDALAGGALYTIDVLADYHPAARRPNVSVVWLNYDRKGLVRRSSFPLYSGRNCIPVSAAPDAAGYRVALRLSGKGQLRVKRLRVVRFVDR